MLSMRILMGSAKLSTTSRPVAEVYCVEYERSHEAFSSRLDADAA
jgi:hypothetical protein